MTLRRLIGTANLYHSATELFQSSYEHNNTTPSCRLYRLAYRRKVPHFPPLFQKWNTQKKNPMMTSRQWR